MKESSAFLFRPICNQSSFNFGGKDTMKIALIGGTGRIGQRIALEALKRGHEVTSIERNPERSTINDPHFKAVQGDARDAAQIANLIAGNDLLISAFGTAGNQPDSVLSDVARALIQAVKQTGVKRLIVVGGAGSLEVAPGVQLMDTPEFPEAWKSNARGQAEALKVYRASDVNWTYVSPAGLIEPGERTGTYRLGTDQLVTDEKGESRISMEDFAVAILDEVEKPQFERRRFTAAY